MKNVRDFVNSKAAKIAAVPTVGALVLAGASAAGATGSDPLGSTYTDAVTPVTTYMGEAAVLIVALVPVSIGIRWLVKALRRGSA